MQLFGCSGDVEKYITFVEGFIADHKNAEITLVGHSKGGAETAAAAVYNKLDSILFNPASVNLRSIGLSSVGYSDTNSMTVYIVKNEPLNKLEGFVSKPIDKIVPLPDPYPDRFLATKAERILNSLNRHAMWGVIKALEMVK